MRILPLLLYAALTICAATVGALARQSPAIDSRPAEVNGVHIHYLAAGLALTHTVITL